MFILTADWHLREDQPTCRTDDFQVTQWEKVRFVLGVAKKNKAEVIVAGDLFHKARPGYSVVCRLIKELQEADIVLNCIPGNHDLPSHSLQQIEASGYGIMAASGWVNDLQSVNLFGKKTVVYAWPWTAEISNPQADAKNKVNIAVLHALVFDSNEVPECWTIQETMWTPDLLRGTIPGADLIVTGHHHKTLLDMGKMGKQIVLNPGSLMRQTADQKDHEPVIFLFDPNKRSLKAIEIPIKAGVVSSAHIEAISKRDERVDKFVNSLSSSYESGLDFRANVEKALEINPLDDLTKQIVLKSMEENDEHRAENNQNEKRIGTSTKQSNPTPNRERSQAQGNQKVRRKNPYAS